MPLEMRTRCELCGSPLGMRDEAFICSYECTFCEKCAGMMNAQCTKLRRRVAAASKAVERNVRLWAGSSLDRTKLH